MTITVSSEWVADAIIRDWSMHYGVLATKTESNGKWTVTL